MFYKETIGSPKFPSHPSECMPRSQTPVVSCTLALSRPGLLPSGHCTPSAFPRCRLRNILWTTTIHISGLHHAAYILVPSSFVLPLLGVHVDFTPDLLARLWSGGICTSPVRTHWVTLTNFMGSLPIPRFRVYLGTSSAWLGRDWHRVAPWHVFRFTSPMAPGEPSRASMRHPTTHRTRTQHTACAEGLTPPPSPISAMGLLDTRPGITG